MPSGFLSAEQVAAYGTFGPAAAAGLVVRRSGGSLRGWLRPLLRWRVPVRYWVYALGLPVVLFGSVGGILAVSGDQVHLDRLGPATDWIVIFILVWLPGGAGEELGWRVLRWTCCRPATRRWRRRRCSD